MKIERAFANGKKSTLLTMSVEKKKLETIISVDGKEKRSTAEASKYAFEEFAKLVAKQLKSGAELTPMKDADAAKIAEQLLADKTLDLDLSDILDAFGPDEKKAIVNSQVAKADAAKKVVGPDHAYARASIFQKCPTQPLLHHFLARMQDGSLKYKYDSGGMNGDLQFFATAISNAARDPSNVSFIVSEVNLVLPDAEPDLKGWLKARISKFKEQAQTKKALATAPKAPAMAEEGLLAAIGEAPSDDAPRQVWADWLSERNHPWGEVVNLQCESERAGATDARRDAIRERLSKIESRATTQFLAPIKAFIAEWSIDRGLLSRVTVSVDKLLKPGAAEAIALRAPGAELTLTGLKKSHVNDLKKLPAGRFGALKLGSKPPADVLKALLQSPLVASSSVTKQVEIWGVDDGTLGALESGLAPSVRSVMLWYSTASTKAVISFVKGKSFEELSFPSPKEPLAHAAIEAIAEMKTLREVHLSLAEGGCGALFSKLKALESLTVLTNGHWDDTDCAALAKLGATGKLKSLSIRATAATAKGMSDLLSLGAESVHLEYSAEGAKLDFSKAKPSEAATFVSSQFSDADALALAKSAFGKKLAYLEIKGADGVGDKGAEALMMLPSVGSSLYLEGANLSAKMSKKLAALRAD